MSKITGVHHIAIRTPAFDRSLGFYRDTLGLSLKATWTTKQGGRAAMIEITPGSYMEIFERDVAPYTGEPALFHFCLRTDDVEGLTEHVRAAGFDVTMEPVTVPIETTIGTVTLKLSFVAGPDGESIELMESDKF